MIRGPILWLFALAGVVFVLGLTAAIGDRNDSGETVSAGRWAQSVCGAVGVWRGTMETIVEGVRTPPAVGGMGQQEPQSETPQGRTVLIRGGLERAVQATETMVEGIDRAGVPDTSQGEEAADLVADWADSALDDLEAAEDSLDEEADSLEESIEQLTGAARAIASTLTSGVEMLADVSQLDPELAQALTESSTCQQLREEQSSQ